MNMKKFGFIIIALLIMPAFSIIASAMNGPFDTLAEAADGRNLMPGREFVGGAAQAWNDGEMPVFLFDGSTGTKYGAGDSAWPYWAAWRYPEAFVADRFILATANDCESNPRRMGDGWKLYGSNDGSDWTVIYIGRGVDYAPVNEKWFFINLSGNTTAYSHYRLWADSGHDSSGIQLSELELTGSIPETGEAAAQAETRRQTPAAPEIPDDEPPPQGFDSSPLIIIIIITIF